jgi:riboflavin synthase
VIKKDKDILLVEAVAETLKMTNLSRIRAGEYVNLERARLLGERLDGHIVQGHIDEQAKITNIKKAPDWIEFTIEVSRLGSVNIVEKGSIALDGISLTIAGVKGKKFNVNIIPYTFEHTNLRFKRIGDRVNIEFDVVGKYVRQYLSERHTR